VDPVLDAGGLVDREQEDRDLELADDEVRDTGDSGRAGERVEEGRVRAGGRPIGVAEVVAGFPLPVARALDLTSRSKVGLFARGFVAGVLGSVARLGRLLLLLVGALRCAGVGRVGRAAAGSAGAGSVTSGTVGISMSSSGVPGGTSTCTSTISPLSSRTCTVSSWAFAGRLPRPTAATATKAATSSV
jgi:hypothetical protein